VQLIEVLDFDIYISVAGSLKFHRHLSQNAHLPKGFYLNALF